MSDEDSFLGGEEDSESDFDFDSGVEDAEEEVEELRDDL
jgi:hypothetical protein